MEYQRDAREMTSDFTGKQRGLDQTCVWRSLVYRRGKGCEDSSVQNSEELLAFNNWIEKGMEPVLGKPC